LLFTELFAVLDGLKTIA